VSPRAKLDVYGDIMSDGSNMWMFHTPDDGRKSLYFGRGSNGNVAEWPIEFKAGGGASFAGNVGPIRKPLASNGVNIGTTNPSQKLDVGSGNVSANDYWIAAAGKWASQGLQCVQKSASGTTGQERTVSCDSGYTVTGVVVTA